MRRISVVCFLLVLSFLFFSANGTFANNLRGDEPQLKKAEDPAPSANYFKRNFNLRGIQAALQEDFEGGVVPAGWDSTHHHPDSPGFQVGIMRPSTTGNNTNVVYVDDDALGSGNSTKDTLYSPSVDLSSYSAVQLDFWHYYNNYSSDSAGVWIIVNGTTWHKVDIYHSDDSGNKSYNITSIAAGESDVKIAFVYDDAGAWAWYWAIDDVVIQAPPADDIGVTEVLTSGNPMGLSGVATTVQAVIQNFGSNSETGFNVQLSVSDGHTDTYTYSNTLAAGDIDTIAFANPWTPAGAGTYTLTSYTELTGDIDPSNDTSSTTMDIIGTENLNFEEDFTAYSGSPSSIGWFGADNQMFGTFTPGTTTDGSWYYDDFGNDPGNTRSARFNFYSSYSDDQDWLITPPIDMTSGGPNSMLNFDIAITPYTGTGSAYFDYDDTLFVVISTDGVTWSRSNIIGMFTQNDTIPPTGMPVSYDLSAYDTETTLFIGFLAMDLAHSGASDYNVYIDNVFVGVPPALDVGPVALVTPIAGGCYGSSESVIVSIQNFATATLDFSVNPVTVDVDISGASTQSFSTTVSSGTLDPDSTLDVTVTTNADLTASGTHTFTISTTLAGDGNPANDTLVTDITIYMVSTYPYLEDFESFTPGSPGILENGWKNVPGDDFDWYVDNGGTPSSATGPDVDHTTGTTSGIYMYTESSSPNNPNKVAYLVSPCFDLGSLSSPILEFWYHMYGATMGELHVDVFAGGTWHLDVMTPLVGQQQTSGSDPWLKATVSLSAYTGSIIAVRFRGITGSSYTSDMAIDDVSVKEAPANPIFSIDPDSAGFGTVAVGEVSAYQTFTITNLGGGTLTIDPAISITGPNAADFDLVDTNTYPVNLGSTESMTVDVACAPQSAGAKSAFLTVTDNLAEVVHNIPLTGTGYQVPVVGFPWFEPFPTTEFDPTSWDTLSIGGTPEIIDINGVASGTFPYPLPSDPYMMEISGSSDEIATGKFDLSGENSVVFSMWKSEHDLEIGEYVLIKYLASDGTWKLLDSLAGTDNGFGVYEPFQFVSYPLPADAYHSNFRLKFMASSNMSSTDEYYFDNLKLSSIEPVLISEIMYNPSTIQGSDTYFEWLELANIGADTVDLSGWQFTSGISYTFDPGTQIPPGEYLVVAKNPDSVMTFYGISNVVGPFSGGLNNSGELVVLTDNGGTPKDSVLYDDACPWPVDGDGFGPSIEVVDLYGDNNEPANWHASLIWYGTPGATNQVPGTPMDTTIKAVQYTTDPSGDSPLLGQLVKVEGTVTCADFVDGGIIIQDSAATWNGVQVSTCQSTFAVGDRVSVYGTVAEFYNRTLLVGTQITYLGAGTVPTPLVVTPGMVNTGSPTAEAYEGVLIEVDNVTVVNPDAGYGEWEVAGSDTLLVDNGPYTYTPALGDSLVFLRGVLNYSFSNFKIAPRNDNDINKWYPEGPTGLIAESGHDGFVPLSWNPVGAFFEGFESGIPSDWQIWNWGTDSSGLTWQATTGDSYEGAQSAYVPYGAVGEFQDEWLVTNGIAINSLNQLHFFHRADYGSYDTDPNFLLVSTTGLPGSFTVIDSFYYPDGTLPSTWTEVTADLSAYSGSTVYLAWQYQSTWGEDWYIDAVSLASSKGRSMPITVKPASSPEALIQKADERELRNPIPVKQLNVKSGLNGGGSSRALLGYNIYRSETPGVTPDPGNLLTSVPAGTNTYTDNAVTNFSNYYYIVTATWDEGESLPSNEASATPYYLTTEINNGSATVVPTLDGVISPGEWDDAEMRYATLNGVGGKFWAKNDGQYLYLAFENSVDHTLDHYDQVGVYFDTDNDDMWAADSSEGNYWLVYDATGDSLLSTFRPWLPDTTTGTQVSPAPGVSGHISAASGVVQYEVAIDLSVAHFNPQPGDTTGFRIYLYDNGPGTFTGYWPETAIYNQPSTFGDMIMASVGFEVSIMQDWNLIGLPLDPPDPYYLSVYPNAVPNTLYRWDGTYQPEDTLEMGTGYWLRFPAAETVTINGARVDSLTLDLITPWNIISGVSCNVALSDVSDPGGIIVPNTLFYFNGTYQPADTIRQGVGYWIRTSAPGQVTLECGAKGTGLLAKQMKQIVDLSQFSTLQISDATGATQQLYFNVQLPEEANRLSYSLPPLPPAGAFDARFAGDMRISEASTAQIQLQASQYPISISVSNLTPEEGFQYVLKEMLPGEEGKTYVLKEGEDIQITNPQVKSLTLDKQRMIPLTFAVQQNYPNPFNPKTIIKYAIPRDEKVEIVIYNTLGQKVKTLVNAQQKAGYYTVEWNATNNSGNKVGSGIYFYSVKAGKHSAIKKMVLLK